MEDLLGAVNSEDNYKIMSFIIGFESIYLWSKMRTDVDKIRVYTHRTFRARLRHTLDTFYPQNG